MSKLHSNIPEDRSWRKNQAHVDADIENLSTNPHLTALIVDMEQKEMPVEEQIETIKQQASNASSAKHAAE